MSLNSFTPLPGLLGGSLIGLSAATLLLFNGDILGASGLMSSFVLTPVRTLTDPSQLWKLAFLTSFCLTTRIYLTMVDADALNDEKLGYSSGLPIVSPLGFAIGGFCVGFGTKRGNGCTSGHGICGLARMSTRSLAAVLAFMTTGIISSTSCSSSSCPFRQDLNGTVAKSLPTDVTVTIGTVLAAAAAGAAFQGCFSKVPQNANASEKEEHDNNKRKVIPAIISAKFFALGLMISQMTLSSKILGFLNVNGIKNGSWDPTLACVMGGGLIVSFLSYQWVKGFSCFKSTMALECPLSQSKTLGRFNVPTNSIIDRKLLIGEGMFGVGWGIVGLCPGPAMVLACAGYPNVLFIWWPAFFIGSYLAENI